MLDPDVRVFDELLAPSIDGLACWTTETDKHNVLPTAHRSLGEALQADGSQAILRLEDGTGGTGLGIQYLATEIVGDSWTGPRVDPETPDAFIRAGRLAYLWFPENESDGVKARFVNLEQLTWRALNSVTAAHLVQSNGKPARSIRIGSGAKQWAMEHPRQRLVSWGAFMKLR
jgi:hypothetical protein